MKVVVVGVGALGSHAVLLCRSLPIDMVLVDDDRVESKNLLAQAHARPSLGRISVPFSSSPATRISFGSSLPFVTA